MTRRPWEVLFLCLVTFLLYANTLWNGFVWDDDAYITKSPWLKEFRYISLYFTSDFCGGVGISCGFYRPFVSLSYLFDYSLWGDNPFGYHLTNILIHILAVLGVYGLTLGLVPFLNKNPSMISNLEGPLLWMPFGSALIFAIHPIHVESVASIANRTDPPTAVFILVSMMGFMRWRQDSNKVGVVWYGVSLLFFIFGLLTKEVTVTMPVLLLAYDFLFVQKRGEDLYRKILIHIPFWIVLGMYFTVRSAAMENGVELVIPWEDILQRLFHIPALLMGYMRLMIFPVGLRLYHPIPSVEDHPIVDGLIPFLVLVILTYLVIRYRRSQPLLGFSLFWVCITLLPVLNLISIKYPAVTERFSYIPSIGFCILLGWLLTRVYGHWGASRNRGIKALGMVSVVVIFMGYSGIVIKRNAVWANNLSLWGREVEMSSSYFLSHHNYGSYLDRAGRFEEASAHYREAIVLNPRDVRPYLNLGNYYQEKGNYIEALRLFKGALRIDSHYFPAQINLGRLYEKYGELDLGIEALEKALKINPNSSMAHYILGNLFIKKKEMISARKELQAAIQIEPEFFEAHYNLGMLYLNEGKLDSSYLELALDVFRKAVLLKPRNDRIYQNMGISLILMGNYLEAEKELVRALEINPRLWRAHRFLGFLYLEQLGKTQEAVYHLEQVKLLNPSPDQILEETLQKLGAQNG